MWRLGRADLTARRNIGTGFVAGAVLDLALDTTNRKIAVAGNFGTFDGSGANYFIRLNGNGTRDSTFAIGQASDRDVVRVVMDPLTGDYLLGGYMTQFNGVAVDRFVRVSYTGIPR